MGGGASLPYDAEVEYLESDGTAYIDTGIKSDGNLHIKTYLVDFFVYANGGKWPFGGRTSSSRDMFGMYINNNDKNVYFAYHTNSGYTKCNEYTSYPQSCIVEIGNGVIKIGETLHTYSSATFTSTKNLLLFGLNNGESQLVWPIKIGATYLTNGTQTLDLIAVRKNGIGYMYDKISGQLIGNSAGSGAFILGPDKIGGG
jgi:hypothetical protein